MKKYILIISFFGLHVGVFGQNKVAELIKGIEGLVANREYLDAYHTLNVIDPDNQNPTILLLKEDIALNFYYKTDKHKQFTFRNFKGNETRETAMLDEGKTETFNIDFAEKLNKFYQLFPDNYLIQKGLGDYYQALADTYGENGEMPILDVFSNIDHYYSEANSTKGNFQTLFGEGHAKTFLGQYTVAKAPLKKALELNGTDATANYDLAYCYWNTVVRDSALTHAFMALDSFVQKDRKADAAFVIASLYAEQGLSKMAIKYFEMANGFTPNEQKILNELVLLYYEVNNDKKASECTNLLFLKDPTKAETYNNLQLLYTDANKFSNLTAFLEQKITEYQSKPSILGALHFYTGSAYLDDSNNAAAKSHFEASKIAFLKFVPKDHAVILKINEALKICDNAKTEQKK
jgi:tetratricopeptide (TPR) repeat protein